MAQTPEGKVKDKVKRLLKKVGAWYCLPVSAGYGQHGIPDVIACYRGWTIGIECKAPGKKGNVTALQKLQLDAIREAGGMSIVVADPEDFKLLEGMLHGVDLTMRILERHVDNASNKNN